MSGAGAEDGHRAAGVAGQDASEFVAQGVVELDDGGEGLPCDVQGDAVLPRVVTGGLPYALDDGVQALLVGGAGCLLYTSPSPRD